VKVEKEKKSFFYFFKSCSLQVAGIFLEFDPMVVVEIKSASMVYPPTRLIFQ
jgi:hypothetical protein